MDKLLALPCNKFLNPRYVIHRYLVTWIRQRGMAVLFLGELAHLLLLTRQKDHLVEHHALGFGNIVNQRQQVNRHANVVDLYVGIGSYQRRQDDAIDIDKAVYLELSFADTDLLLTDLEIVQGNMLACIVLGKILVNKELSFLRRQELLVDAPVLQLVSYLTDLDKEILPLLAVIAEQPAFLVFLGNGYIGRTVLIFPSLEILEIAP